MRSNAIPDIRHGSLWASTALMLVIASQAGVASAQTAAPAPEQDTAKSAGLEDIIVVGEKRERLLQSTPLAITAVTNDALERSNIHSATDLSGLAPSLIVTREEGFERAVTIRGLGKNNTQSNAIAQSVALHQDGIFFPSTVSLNSDLVDVNRIEVLRGPQGTVFGQNAIGGVINIVTNQPKIGVLEGYADLAGGNYGLFQARAAVNLPIGDKLAIRLTGQQFQHDGYTRNLVTGQDLDEENNHTGRVQVLWQPVDDLRITARYQIFDTDVNGQAQRSVFDTSGDKRTLQQNFPAYFAYNSKVASLNVEFVRSWFVAKLIGSHQIDHSRVQTDNDRGISTFTNYITPSDTTGAITGVITDDRIVRNNVDRNVDTAELNIVSAGGGNFDWIIGAFYSSNKSVTDFLELGDGFNGAHDGKVQTEASIDKANPFFNPDLGFQTLTRADERQWSIYGQATVHLTPTLRVTGGLRYTDARDISNAVNYYVQANPQVSNDKFLTGKAGLEYDIAPNALSYLTFTRGTKPGGGSLTSGTLVKGVFRKETLNAVEAGLKTRFLNNRLQLNAAIFYYDFHDFQFISSDPTPFGAGVVNIPRSRNYGAELEASALLTDHTRLDFSGSYQESKITEDFFAIDSVVASFANAYAYRNGISTFTPDFSAYNPVYLALRSATAQNLKGNRLPRTPRFSFNTTLSQTFDLLSPRDLTASLNYNWMDSLYVRPFQTPGRDRVGAYGLLSASINWTHRHWSLELSGSNLFDKSYINNRFTDAFGVSSTSDAFVPPRLVRFRVGYKF